MKECGLSRILNLASPRSQRLEPVGGFGRFGCSGEDRFFVALQDAEPILDVTGMIITRLRGDTQIAAQEGCA